MNDCFPVSFFTGIEFKTYCCSPANPLDVYCSSPPLKANSETPSLEWERFFSGVEGYSVIQEPDGEYVVLGSQASIFTDRDINFEYRGNFSSVLIKTDSVGTLLWMKNFQIEGYETELYRLIQTSDGGYALAGTRRVLKTVGNFEFPIYSNISSFCLVKVNSQGNTKWTKTYINNMNETSNYLGSFTQTSDGGYVLLGRYTLFSDHSYTWFVKADTMGNLQWNKTLKDFDYVTSSIFQTSDEGYLLIGHTPRPRGGGRTSFVIAKTDSSASVNWHKTYGGVSRYYSAYSYCGIATGDGGYIIAGSVAPESGASSVGWLVKTDLEGEMLWNKTYGGGSIIHSIAQTSDGGFIFSGTQSEPILPSYIAWVGKTDSSGNLQGELKIGSSTLYSDSVARSVIAADNGKYVFTGHWNQTDLARKPPDMIWLAKGDISSLPAPSASPSPSPSPEPQQTEQFLTILGVAFVVTVVGAGLGLLIYLIKKNDKKILYLLFSLSE